MATLTGNTVASTYKQLLKVTSEGIGADASAKYIEDGLGTDSALSISTTRVGIGTADPTSDLDIGDSGGGDLTLSRTGDANIVDGNNLGAIYFKGHDDSGSNVQPATGAKIVGQSVGTWDQDDVDDAPTELQFWTCSASGAISIAQRMVIDPDGNVGIGVVPETSHASYTTLQIGGLTSILSTSAQSAGGSTWLANNAYIDSSGAASYIVTDEASAYRQVGGGHNFYTVVSGSADADMSWTTNMVLDANSRISLSNNDGSGTSTVFGSLAGRDLAAAGNENTFIGDSAGLQNTIGINNIAIGHNAMDDSYDNATTDAENDNNVFIGHNSGGGTWAAASSNAIYANHDNIGIGTNTLDGAMTGAVDNVAIGSNALTGNTTGTDNTAVGHNSMATNVGGGSNVSLGSASLYYNASGDENVGIGYGSLYYNSTASENTAVGYQSGFYNQTGTGNALFGFKAGRGTTVAQNSNNSAFGHSALTAITTGSGNVALGSGALDGTDDGGYNVAIGYGVLSANCGDGSVAIGSLAGSVYTGDQLIAIGQNAAKILTGTGNTAVGYGTMEDLVEGTNNTAFGYNAFGGALDATADASTDNVFIGHNAGSGDWVTTASTGNVAIGSGTMNGALNDADDNTIIGYGANPSAVGAQNQSVIGKGATGVADNSVTLGNADVTAVYMSSDSQALVHSAGIQFAGTQVANAGANVLDDYEEGYHTFVVDTDDDDAWDVRSGYQKGAYTKVGRVVHFQGGFEITATGGKSDDGAIQISLPFACAALDDVSEVATGSCHLYNTSGLSNAYNTVVMTTASTSLLSVAYTSGAGADTAFATGGFTHTSAWEFRFQITYIAA